MKKRIVACILAAMMVVAAFAGCGKKEESGTSEKDVKLTVWGPTETVDLLKEQCNAFIKETTDRKISIEVKGQSESDAATVLQNDPEKGADVFGFPSDHLANLIDKKLLLPVAEGFVKDIKANNTAGSVEASSDSSGKLYAYPETGNGYYLVYDKSVVKDPSTLEGILEDCKKNGKKFYMDAGNGYYSCMFVFTGGLKTTGIKDGVQQFNKYDPDKVVASMKAFSTLMHKYDTTFVSDAVSKIQSGFKSTAGRASTIGAGIDGIWNSKSDEDALGANYGAAKLPTINIDGTPTQIVSMYGYKMIGVNAYTKYPETASMLANYLTNEKCQRARAEKYGWSPTNNKLTKDDKIKANASINALLEQGSEERSVPQANLKQAFWDPMGTIGKTLILKDTNPDSFDFKALLDKAIRNITS